MSGNDMLCPYCGGYHHTVEHSGCKRSNPDQIEALEIDDLREAIECYDESVDDPISDRSEELAKTVRRIVYGK